MKCVSPWYNRTGWLGVKHQLTYLLIIGGSCHKSHFRRNKSFVTTNLCRDKHTFVATKDMLGRDKPMLYRQIFV